MYHTQEVNRELTDVWTRVGNKQVCRSCTLSYTAIYQVSTHAGVRKLANVSGQIMPRKPVSIDTCNENDTPEIVDIVAYNDDNHVEFEDAVVTSDGDEIEFVALDYTHEVDYE